MSEAPAALAGLSGRKGRIAPGYDADLVVWDPDAEFTVDAARLQQRHKLTPYAGRRLRGTVRTTFVRGQRVWDAAASCSRRRSAAMSAAVREISIDLASERLGGAAVAANDEFFAPKERLSSPTRRSGAKANTPIAASGWTAGKPAAAATCCRASPGSTRRTTGASSGSAPAAIVRGVDVETTHFKGNFPSRARSRRASCRGH